ncbi:DnaD domain-containing protein [Levilactobacillus bambusae]|uniref:DNA replication protein DnaD n=1 Tax=Levilactobacillus bambusae TaxID=2024736 RepID=A0A2V1N1G9_9LACO|nr:DnaD domain protein [Levilactobacillus bambusae]PWG00873.1 DNA replication protein DnaD [Levilactobacillus bambusae]
MDNFAKHYLAAGQTSLSNYLLSHYHELGMTNDQFLVYLQLKGQLDRGNESPKADDIASALGWDVQEVYSVLHQMISAKLMQINTKREADGLSHDQYDFSLLAEKLSMLDQQTVNVISATNKKFERKVVFEQIQQEFGRLLSPMEMQEVNGWLDEDHYEPNLIVLALKEAVLNQAYSLRYMDKILLNWERKNLTTAQQVQKERERQLESQQDKGTGKQPGQQKLPHIPLFNLTDPDHFKNLDS